MRAAYIILALTACEPPRATPETTAGVQAPVATPRADPCRDDIPDCAAACALRETGRRDYLDFYDRRCATVMLGKNPDKVELHVATPATTSTTSLTSEFPPDVRASLTATHTPFDPTSVSRIGGSEPAECKAARILRSQHREREADMLDALCIAKGGDAGT
jgi:hypothetical protein